VTTGKQPPNPARKRAKPAPKPAAEDAAAPEATAQPPAAEPPVLVGEFIAKGEEPAADGGVSAEADTEKADEEVVERVEHLNHSVGWVLISAGVIGLVVPGVLGTPFLIMGALALWPGNRKTVERWRKGHSPKIFHGAMKQINRFLDDLDKRYPRIDKPKK